MLTRFNSKSKPKPQSFCLVSMPRANFLWNSSLNVILFVTVFHSSTIFWKKITPCLKSYLWILVVLSWNLKGCRQEQIRLRKTASKVNWEIQETTTAIELHQKKMLSRTSHIFQEVSQKVCSRHWLYFWLRGKQSHN